METKHVCTSLGFIVAAVSVVSGQGTFQNLDFEEANIVPITGQPFAVTIANALPGWAVYYGGVQQTQITYNDLSLGGTAASLIASGYPREDTTLTPLDGNFSILLYGGAVNGVRTPASITQTGEIPSGTRSLLFEWAGSPLAQPVVSIGNDNLSLFSVASGVYGANISAWAGQTEQLTITVPGGDGPYEFDDISFSPVAATPEPEPLVLTGLGAALLGAYRRFVQRRR